ncbi:EAL domain-containing protein [Leptothrix discophora]|uniref:EAL domain-containing protein n=1 Tax=Leptothrix discophora TaxID=89 RepID=A0ABT9G7F9_LEPDI|nr:EAL domain-containing protein [Leptothrix discophora]MDP4302405.1 EAL domain-containing protein [Leptothrix discophora]
MPSDPPTPLASFPISGPAPHAPTVQAALQEALRQVAWHAGMLARTEALSRAGSFEVEWPSGRIKPSLGLRTLLGECEALGLGDVAPTASATRGFDEALNPCRSLNLAPGCTRDCQPASDFMAVDALAWVPAEERAYVAGIWRNAELDEPFEFQHRVICRDGRRLVVLHRGVRNATHGVAMLHDLTAQREAEQRIQHLVHHDEISGLPNRAALLDQIDAAMHAARWSASGLALLAIDVPRIAEIKASMGYGAGDTLAMSLAARLKDHCGEGAVIARVGDTEFAWLIELPAAHGSEAAPVPVPAPAPAPAPAPVPTPAVDPEAQVRERAEALHAALCAPVRLGSTEVFPLPAIGIAAFPADADSPAGLIESAQSARLGLTAGGGVGRFHQSVADRARRDMHVESELRHAIAHGELSLVYQPQVELGGGAVCGAEALLRWTSARLGVVSPAEFIPIAERSGLIGAIGDWVLHQACTQAVAWRRAGLPPLRISVNLSPVQLQRPDFARHVQAVLQQTGATPEQLAVELTESTLLHDIDSANSVLHAVKALGVEIALDDFGTGYSSLNSLSRLPIDVLKVDRSFVHDVTAATQRVSVTRAIIHMAHGLQMRVLAEGVETEGQLALLASHGCDLIQGYWFSRPLDPQAFEALLRSGRRLPEPFVKRTERERTLLLVDDEPNILNALKRLLRHDGYHIVTATSAAEGLQRLAEQTVDVIVSDQRMPGMTGVEFLHRARALYPSTVRLVLSGFTELQSIIDAVNEGAIYKFLTKPWDDQRLRSHVAEAFRQKELSDENRRLALQVETANADLAALNERLGALLGQQRVRTELMAASADGLRDVLDELPVALLGVDPEGMVAYANGAAEGLLHERGLPLGLDLGEVLPELQAAGGGDGQGPGLSPHLRLGGRDFRVIVSPVRRPGQVHEDPPRAVLFWPEDGRPDGGPVRRGERSR